MDQQDHRSHAPARLGVAASGAPPSHVSLKV
ncbi:hypothetical protein GGR40_002395 [Novosphingobium gossypii]